MRERMIALRTTRPGGQHNSQDHGRHRNHILFRL